MKKTFFLIILLSSLAFVTVASADWSLSRFFMNKIPLKPEIKTDIKQFFIANIHSLKIGLACFPKASNKSQASFCAKKVDFKMAALMKLPQSETTVMQERINKLNWNENQKKILLSEIKLNLQEQRRRVRCIEKADTMGDLDHCFTNGRPKK